MTALTRSGPALWLPGKKYLLTLRQPQFDVRQTGDPGDITHAFKLNLVYDLPFGEGRRFGGAANAAVKRIISLVGELVRVSDVRELTAVLGVRS